MKATPLNELVEQWKADAAINKIDPDKDLLVIPNLHAKYCAQLVAHSMEKRKQERDLVKIKRIKWKYYDGKMSKEELEKLGWEPFQFVLKSQIGTFIDSDDDVLKQQILVDQHEEAVDFCKLVVKQLNDRTYQIRAYLDHIKYTIGH